MSSFSCEKCGTLLLDTERGYVTECSHYPIENRTNRHCPICKAQIFDPFGQGKLIHDVNECRDLWEN
jgi:primosomal protein N'